MAEAPARAWLRQVMSDWQASQLSATGRAAHCQVIGKQQQAAEKSVKAVLAALRQRGLLRVPTPRGHTVEIEIGHIVSALKRFSRKAAFLTLSQLIQNLFHGKNAVEINELCALAPRWPPPGSLFPRNAEYPFEEAANAWLAPADSLVFSNSDLRKFTNLAEKIVIGTGKAVAAAEK